MSIFFFTVALIIFLYWAYSVTRGFDTTPGWVMEGYKWVPIVIVIVFVILGFIS